MSGSTVAVTLIVLAAGIAVGLFLYPSAAWLRRRINPDDPDELLRTAIEEHPSDDEIEAAEVKQERKMLRSILDLAEVTVVEVMTHRRQMVTIDADLPAGEIVDSALASPFTRLPLWRGEPDNIIGVLHAKSLLREVRAARGKMESFAIEEVASQPWF